MAGVPVRRSMMSGLKAHLGSPGTPTGGLFLIAGTLLAAVCINLFLTQRLRTELGVLHARLALNNPAVERSRLSGGSKPPVQEGSQYFTSDSSVALTPAQLQQLAAAVVAAGPGAPAAAVNHEPRGLYLGDGKVFCYAAPLGRPMLLEGADVGITIHLCRGVGWEPDTSAVFKRLVKADDAVVDVGTNVGYFTLMFSDLVGGKGRVLGIEAQPRTYELVSSTVELNGLAWKTKVINRAAFNEDGKKVMISASRTRTLNNRLVTGGTDTGTDAVPVETITIDTAVAGWNRLDLIKIDVEGAEGHTYAGMKKTLARFPKLVIIMEVNTARMGADKALAFYQQLQKDFPTLRRLVGSSIEPVTVQQLHSNRVSDDLVVLTHRTDVH